VKTHSSFVGNGFISKHSKQFIMKDYMLLFRGGMNPRLMESPELMQQDMMKWKAWIDKIAAQGKYVGGQPLQPHGKVLSGKLKKITDGPFAETKEILGGYFHIKADSYEDAVEISKEYPGFENDGSVEVREIMEMVM
jgi:hypothetical protein